MGHQSFVATMSSLKNAVLGKLRHLRQEVKRARLHPSVDGFKEVVRAHMGPGHETMMRIMDKKMGDRV